MVLSAGGSSFLGQWDSSETLPWIAGGLLLCGRLKENGPKGSGIVRRCGFVGVDMTSWEEVCHCGGRL